MQASNCLKCFLWRHWPITAVVMQAGQQQREDVLAALTALVAKKLKPARRVVVVLFQCRLQRSLSDGGGAAVAPATLRAWMQKLPQALWELGPSRPDAARAALEVLRRGSTNCTDGGAQGGQDRGTEGALMEELEPMVAANFGVVRQGRGGPLVPGPLLGMPEDVQVWCCAFAAVQAETVLRLNCRMSEDSRLSYQRPRSTTYSPGVVPAPAGIARRSHVAASVQVAAADLLASVPHLSPCTLSLCALLTTSKLLTAPLRHRFIRLIEAAAPSHPPSATLPLLLSLAAGSDCGTLSAVHAYPEPCTAAASGAATLAAQHEAWTARVDTCAGACAALCRLEQARSGVLACAQPWSHRRCASEGDTDDAAARDARFLACVGALTLFERASWLQLITDSNESWSATAAMAAAEFVRQWVQRNSEQTQAGGGTALSAAATELMDWPPRGAVVPACPQPEWALRCIVASSTCCAHFVHALQKQLQRETGCQANVDARQIAASATEQSAAADMQVAACDPGCSAAMTAVLVCCAGLLELASQRCLQAVQSAFEALLAQAKETTTTIAAGGGDMRAPGWASAVAALQARLRACAGSGT